MLKLYDTPISGNCHKVRLMLSILGIEYEKIPVSLPDGEQKKPDYMAIHPFGKVPAIDDDGVYMWDSQAILVYLATKYGNTDWYPDDPVERGQVHSWLSVAANEMFNGPAVARAMIQERARRATPQAPSNLLRPFIRRRKATASAPATRIIPRAD